MSKRRHSTTQLRSQNNERQLARRATKLKRRHEQETGESIPMRVWMERVNGSGKGDLSYGFTCRQCGYLAHWEGGGTGHRNHCPNCLHSLHLDQDPGDRKAACGGVMEPISVWVRKGGEWAIVHRCRDCGALSSNRIAADDRPEMLVSIAMRPMALPPFPLERMVNLVNVFAD